MPHSLILCYQTCRHFYDASQLRFLQRTCSKHMQNTWTKYCRDLLYYSSNLSGYKLVCLLGHYGDITLTWWRLVYRRSFYSVIVKLLRWRIDVRVGRLNKCYQKPIRIPNTRMPVATIRTVKDFICTDSGRRFIPFMNQSYRRFQSIIELGQTRYS